MALSNYHVARLIFSKFDSRKLSTLMNVSFLIELTFLSWISAFSRDLNDHSQCSVLKKNFQTVAVFMLRLINCLEKVFFVKLHLTL